MLLKDDNKLGLLRRWWTSKDETLRSWFLSELVEEKGVVFKPEDIEENIKYAVSGEFITVDELNNIILPFCKKKAALYRGEPKYTAGTTVYIRPNLEMLQETGCNAVVCMTQKEAGDSNSNYHYELILLTNNNKPKYASRWYPEDSFIEIDIPELDSIGIVEKFLSK